ncbi:hypothetical protein CEE37_03220 [candidate division LCP-89 bacterium B3_LCP]|uniref:Glycosyltransferase RgtA/B/C/D-like domain-containing protein n=1 Tax=candidate division LCP-89 bacterium B3_LCP TaxID=2012998 RepID=A0A532V364_UNCL8|nr:MAG: hypothetical protein CEE37_03220 [candidate division LCP-89 bacterium B3_LCP]
MTTSSGRNTPEKMNRQDVIALIVLFLSAILFRLIRLFDLDLNFDESVLLLLSNSSFGEIFEFCKTDNFPPLYPWMIKLWVSISEDVRWYRLFGALMGALTPPVAYLLGREVVGRRLGWILGAATAISVSLIFYSQFVRMFNAQPLLVCLSVYWFLKALRTNQPKYWLFTGLANLVGFYIYVFSIFLFCAEIVVLIIIYRVDLKKYARPFIASIPFFIGVAIWLPITLSRYEQMAGTFWISPLKWFDYIEVLFTVGTGTDFRNHHLLGGLVNLPFIIGSILGISQSRFDKNIRSIFLILLLVLCSFTIVSLMGQSFMLGRYLIFILPLYLTLATVGWFSVKNVRWRNLGLVFLTFSMVISLSYYYIDYYHEHDYYGFVRPLPSSEDGEGHHLSVIADEVEQHLIEGDVIIHYSNPYLRVCSFYAMLWYHKRSLPEYIYSREEIAQHNGRQYLQPGEWIRSLYDLDPLPEGIWMISLDDTKTFFDEDVLMGKKRPHWISHENLPLELREAGYDVVDTIVRGKVSAIYFRKSDDEN